MKSLLSALTIIAASKKALATGAIAMPATIVTHTLGLGDPLPWLVATAGMVCMLIMSEPDEKKSPKQIQLEALLNCAMSIFCGVFGGEWAATVVAEYVNPKLAHPIAMTFLISAFWQVVYYKAWPAVCPMLLAWLRKKLGVENAQ